MVRLIFRLVVKILSFAERGEKITPPTVMLNASEILSARVRYSRP